MASAFEPAPHVWAFVAQLVEHCSANAEETDSNPAEALITFFGGYFAIKFLKLRLQLQFSHLHFISRLFSHSPHTRKLLGGP